MFSDRTRAWITLALAAAALVVLVVDPWLFAVNLACGVGFSLLFLLGMWLGPRLALAQRVSEPPRTGNEGLATAVLGLLVFAESTLPAYLLHRAAPVVPIWATCGAIVLLVGLRHTSWLPRQLSTMLRLRRLATSAPVDQLVAVVGSDGGRSASATSLVAAELLLDRRRWADATALLEAFAPRPKQPAALQERWFGDAFRAATMAGDLTRAAALVSEPPVQARELVEVARLWLAALQGDGETVLVALEGRTAQGELPPGSADAELSRPVELDGNLEQVLRAHALVALGRDDEARRVLDAMGDLAHVLEPPGPASSLARGMRP